MPPRCPTCKKLLPEPSPATSPFCGSRCKLADLGSWLDGKYVVASPAFALDDVADELVDDSEESDARRLH